MNELALLVHHSGLQTAQMTMLYSVNCQVLYENPRSNRTHVTCGKNAMYLRTSHATHMKQVVK